MSKSSRNLSIDCWKTCVFSTSFTIKSIYLRKLFRRSYNNKPKLLLPCRERACVWEKIKNFLHSAALFWKSSSVVVAKDTQHASASSKYWLKATIFSVLRSHFLPLSETGASSSFLFRFGILFSSSLSVSMHKIVSFTIAAHFACRRWLWTGVQIVLVIWYANKMLVYKPL